MRERQRAEDCRGLRRMSFCPLTWVPTRWIAERTPPELLNASRLTAGACSALVQLLFQESKHPPKKRSSNWPFRTKHIYFGNLNTGKKGVCRKPLRKKTRFLIRTHLLAKSFLLKGLLLFRSAFGSAAKQRWNLWSNNTPERGPGLKWSISNGFHQHKVVNWLL